MKKINAFCLAGALSVAAFIAACGGGNGPAGQMLGQGTAQVSLTDAPACGFDEVNVTVTKVRIHQSDSADPSGTGWSEIMLNPARKINLLDLTNGVLTSLGQVTLPAGHYTQMRLVLDPNTGSGLANSVVLTGSSTEMSLDTPSAVRSGIKLINEFDVATDERVDLVLDFDACKSVVPKGNGRYALKPVITAIPTVANGIDGFVDTALLAKNVRVSAQQDGEIIRATTPDTNGEFFLARLETGDYDVVITADDYATAVIADVPIADETSVVGISTSNAPFNLQSSSTRSVSGTLVLDPASSTEVGFAAAKQSFVSGPTVTVKSQGANITTGAYTLSNLPTAAPQLGQYSASLPIALVTQTNTVPGTGIYAVEATANGYVTQQDPSVDINVASQTGVNFTLMP